MTHIFPIPFPFFFNRNTSYIDSFLWRLSLMSLKWMAQYLNHLPLSPLKRTSNLVWVIHHFPILPFLLLDLLHLHDLPPPNLLAVQSIGHHFQSPLIFCQYSPPVAIRLVQFPFQLSHPSLIQVIRFHSLILPLDLIPMEPLPQAHLAWNYVIEL